MNGSKKLLTLLFLFFFRLQGMPDSVSAKSCSEIEANFKTISRNMLSLGQSLSSNKEVRDFFVHLVEKLCDPLRSIGVTKAEAEAFLAAYAEALSNGGGAGAAAGDGGGADGVKRTLAKFMKTLTPCILAVY